MNVSPSAHATGAAHGAHGKHGKGSGDPLADFMALLGQLGIAADADGKLTTTPATPAGAEDIAAKILAKLGKETGDQPAADIVKLPEGSESDDGDDGDPAAKLADMLANLDQQLANPGKDTGKLDIAGLLNAVRALAENAKPNHEDGTEAVGQIGTTPSASVASLLARTNRENNTGTAATPGNMQAAFVRLQKLVTGKTDQEAASAANDDVAPITGKSEAPATSETKTAESAKADNAATTKLTELLARLTASAKPGATTQSLPQQAQAGVANQSKPVAHPQIAALAQALQQAYGKDRSTDDTGDQSGITSINSVAPTFGVASMSAAAPAADAGQMTTTTDVSADVMHHHLDLARDSEWLDTLARDIARAAQSDTHLRFNLNPEHLGSLKVELLNGANGTSVKLTADTEAARAILADAQPRLVAEAKAQGLRISEAQVSLSHQGQSGHGGQRQASEAPVVIRTSASAAIAEVEQDVPAGSGERYA